MASRGSMKTAATALGVSKWAGPAERAAQRVSLRFPRYATQHELLKVRTSRNNMLWVSRVAPEVKLQHMRMPWAHGITSIKGFGHWKIGCVVSTRADKTINVMCEHMKLDKKSGLLLRRRRKHMGHDPDELCREGDIVLMRPLFRKRRKNKRKNYKVIAILHRDPDSEDIPDATPAAVPYAMRSLHQKQLGLVGPKPKVHYQPNFPVWLYGNEPRQPDRFVVRLDNLPVDATSDEVRNFLRYSIVANDNVHFFQSRNSRGKKSAIVEVEFERDLVQALPLVSRYLRNDDFDTEDLPVFVTRSHADSLNSVLWTGKDTETEDERIGEAIYKVANRSQEDFEGDLPNEKDWEQVVGTHPSVLAAQEEAERVRRETADAVKEARHDAYERLLSRFGIGHAPERDLLNFLEEHPKSPTAKRLALRTLTRRATSHRFQEVAKSLVGDDEVAHVVELLERRRQLQELGRNEEDMRAADRAILEAEKKMNAMLEQEQLEAEEAAVAAEMQTE
ncbi:MAG: hypothetical protein MHM6MM_006952 [Cercozoa sp. M6MM]